MEPKFFAKPGAFRKWLEKHHLKETELLVGFYKVGSGKPSITWPQSVDEALCFGWIDGVRKNIDEVSYSIRFTPRKATSIWSAINIKKMDKMIGLGLVAPAGLAAYEKRAEKRSKIYSHETAPKILLPAYVKKFRMNKEAWKFFTAQAPYYQRLSIHRIMTAKQTATQITRLEKIIEASARGEKLL